MVGDGSMTLKAVLGALALLGLVANVDCLLFQNRLLPYPFTKSRNFGYVGCFQDNTRKRDLPTMMTLLNPQMTVDMCSSMCLSWPFFALQAGGTCYCGTKYGQYGKLPDSSCNKACFGAPNQACGANTINSVYGRGVGSGGTGTPGGEVDYNAVSNAGVECEDAGLISRAAATTIDNCAASCMNDANCFFIAYGRTNCIMYRTCHRVVPSTDTTSTIYAIDKNYPSPGNQICSDEGKLPEQPSGQMAFHECAQLCMNTQLCVFISYVINSRTCLLFNTCPLVSTSQPTIVLQVKDSTGVPPLTRDGTIALTLVDQDRTPWGNVPVDLLNSSGAVVDSKTTSAAGSVSFTAPAGSYTIRPQFPSGVNVRPTTEALSLVAGSNPARTIVFERVTGGNGGGTGGPGGSEGSLNLQFVDKDGNAVPGLDVEFYQGEQVVAVGTTDSNGNLVMTLPAGEYVLAVVVPSDYVVDGDEPIFEIELGPGDNIEGTVPLDIVKGGQGATGRIVGSVYNDQNNDNRVDSGEGVSGVTISLRQGSATITQKTTDSEGSFEFGDLPVGTYLLTMGPIPSLNIGGSQNSSPITVSGGATSHFDFRITGRSTTTTRPPPSITSAVPKATINIRMFLDANNNEMFESNEEVFPNVPVVLKTDQEEEVGRGTTSQTGEIRFTDLDPGYYIVDADLSVYPELELGVVQGVIQVSRVGEQVTVEFAIQTS